MTNVNEMRRIVNLLEASNQLSASKPTIGIDHDKFNAALDRGDLNTMEDLWFEGRTAIRDIINNYRTGDTFIVYSHDGHWSAGFSMLTHTLETVQLDKNEKGIVVISSEGEDYEYEIVDHGSWTLDSDAFDYDNYVTVVERDLNIIDTMYGIVDGSTEQLGPNQWKRFGEDDTYTLRELFDSMSNSFGVE